MIRELILDKIDKIKQQEGDFKTDEWSDVYASFTYDDDVKTERICTIDFSTLNDNDLVRLFEYLILVTNRISEIRVKKTYGL